jgi:hypothetical protein
MAISTDGNFKDLEAKGFVHIPGFLSPAELQACRDDFQKQPLSENKNYGVSVVSEGAVARLKDRIQEILKNVSATTNLQVDCTLGGGYFATGRGISFPWHQDYESFFSAQNHYDYLNFYIPIVKPRRDKSNLTVVPFDVLERESPSTFRKVVRGGATRFVPIGTKHIVVADDAGTAHVMPVDIERLAYTPMLDAGDLLLMRGDVIHRTQDADTERVSLSLRAAFSKTVIRRSRLADGPMAKVRTMVNNPPMYEPLFRAFEETGRNELQISELIKWATSAAPKAASDRRTFYRYLLMQKVRSGVVFSTLRKTVSSSVSIRLYQLANRQAT